MSEHEADWTVIEKLLPKGWRELATTMGMVRERPAHIGQKFHDIEVPLRLILHYIAQRGSMRQTTSMAKAAGFADISQPALFKWMFKIGRYLETLVAAMVEPSQYASGSWGGYDLIVADGTTVQRPGAMGTTARIHYALKLADLSPRFIRITDATVGETARNFDAELGELWILDRGYSNAASVFALVDRGADMLVRVNRQSLPLYDARGKRILMLDLLAATKKRGRAEHRPVQVRMEDRVVSARLVWLWLPKDEAKKARARAASEGVVDAIDLDASEYIVLLTTASKRRLDDAQLVELYRARWQVELDFKRDKTIGDLDALPSLLPQTIHAWLCGKVLLGLIARRLASQKISIPPCALAKAFVPNAQLSGDVDRTLVRDASRLGHDPQCASAHEAA